MMEESKEEDQVPNSSPDLGPPKDMTIDPHPKDKRKRPLGIKIKFTQIQKKPPPEAEPSNKHIVLYESPGESRSPKKKRVAVNDLPKSAETKSSSMVLYETPGESRSFKRKRVVVDSFQDSAEIKTSTLERAEEFRATLGTEFPSFAKTLVRSNVTVGFWMHLPMRFCKMHLPKDDTTVFLEDDEGGEYILNYIADRTALSGGWKHFIGSHELAEGDVLVFQLVKSLRFKVYVVKGQGSEKVDDKLAASASHSVSRETKRKSEEKAQKSVRIRKKPKQLELLANELADENNPDNDEDNHSVNSLMLMDANKETVDQPANYSADHVPEPLDIVKSSERTTEFRDTTSLESFSIVVNGSAIDSELSDDHRTKYYELCCSQNSYLHSNLLQSINYKLAAEIIIGTVNISDAIRTSKLLSSREDYAVWDKTLKGFELLGMNVSFLRARLGRLMVVAKESEEAMESESRVIRLEQARMSEEISSLETKLLEMKEARGRLDEEMDSLRENAEKLELMFQEVLDSPF